LHKPVQANRFRTFAQCRQNGFVALGICFRTVSSPAQDTEAKRGAERAQSIKETKKKPRFYLEH
jgi:hypothetical protein